MRHKILTFELDENIRVMVTRAEATVHPWDESPRKTNILWWNEEIGSYAPESGKKLTQEEFEAIYRMSRLINNAGLRAIDESGKSFRLAGSVAAIALQVFDKYGGVVKHEYEDTAGPLDGVMYVSADDESEAREVLEQDFKLLNAWTCGDFYDVWIEERISACDYCRRTVSWEQFDENACRQFVWTGERGGDNEEFLSEVGEFLGEFLPSELVDKFKEIFTFEESE